MLLMDQIHLLWIFKGQFKILKFSTNTRENLTPRYIKNLYQLICRIPFSIMALISNKKKLRKITLRFLNNHLHGFSNFITIRILKILSTNNLKVSI